MTSNVDITNRALAEIGSRSRVTALDPTSKQPESMYAALLYNDLRDFLLREGDYDFSLKVSVSALSGASPPPWLYAYAYPSDAIKVRGLIPTVYDPLDPHWVDFNIFNNAGARSIATREQIVNILYTFAPVEDQWDSMFTESYIRLLASALTHALQNRIAASREMLQESISFAGIANLRVG